jgi:hypothetical protein
LAGFAVMHKTGMDYRELVESLGLKAKVKKGAGFAKHKKKNEAHDVTKEAS